MLYAFHKISSTSSSIFTTTFVHLSSLPTPGATHNTRVKEEDVAEDDDDDDIMFYIYNIYYMFLYRSIYLVVVLPSFIRLFDVEEDELELELGALRTRLVVFEDDVDDDDVDDDDVEEDEYSWARFSRYVR